MILPPVDQNLSASVLLTLWTGRFLVVEDGPVGCSASLTVVRPPQFITDRGPPSPVVTTQMSPDVAQGSLQGRIAR